MKIKSSYFIAVGLCVMMLIGLSACTAEITPTPTASPSPPQTTGGDAKFYSDYDALWSIIETEYPFLTVAGRV
ncbi:MAG: hypothetical protein RR807_08700, partial [Oscillospiraceae bacterium]